MADFAYYVRTSTAKQKTGSESQVDAIQSWFDENNESFQRADEFVDLERSGSDPEREGFVELVDAVKANEYDAVVMVEISRISRILSESADFIDATVDTDTKVYLLDEMIDAIDPDDPMSAFFAKQLSLWYEEEAKQARRRALRGRRKAIREGKWDRRPPLGFRVDEDGYLEPVLEPREEDETSYLSVVAAIERIENEDASYAEVARDSGLNRVTLMDIHKDDERRTWYLDGEKTSDDRIEEALEQVGSA